MMTLKENQIISVDDYLNYLGKYNFYKKEGKLFFRGQLSKFKDMRPSIARNENVFSRESKIYEKYIKKHNCSKNDIIRNLAEMQHYNEKTRLLDFTTDPLVALFFATQENEREDSSVYLLIRHSYDAASEEAKLSSFVATQSNRDIEYILEKFNRINGTCISIERAEQILKHAVFIRPDTINDAENYRMNEQKGTFSIPGNKIENGCITDIVPIENDYSYEEIVIPFEYHEKIRKGLIQRGYTKERLLEEDSTEIDYGPLPKDNIKIIDGKHDHKAYNQYKVTIAMSCLMTIKEIEDKGYQIAQESGADSVWIWFRRPGAESGNNIVNQHWYRESINMYGWSGKRFKDLMLDENKQNSYISYEYFQKNYKHLKLKHLPIEKDAKEIELQVIMKNNNQLYIKTNLIKGTKLVLLYKIDGINDGKIISLSGRKLNQIDIRIDHKFHKLEVGIIIPVSSVQDASIQEAYGIDYEKIKADFIKRSDNELISGYKEFEFLNTYED